MPRRASVSTVMSIWGTDGQALTGVDEVQAHVEAGRGQQQSRDELARAARVDRDLAAADVAAPADREGQRPGAAVVDVGTDLAQCLDHLAHRAVQGARVCREGDVAVGQPGERAMKRMTVPA
jgi:hypothetical protein